MKNEPLKVLRRMRNEKRKILQILFNIMKNCQQKEKQESKLKQKEICNTM